MSLFDFLKPARVRPPLDDPIIVQRRYRYWRWRIFYSMYFGYALYYFSRKSLTFVVPVLIEQGLLTVGGAGKLASILSLTYGVSKFVSGIIGDRSNPQYFMGVGLMLTGVTNIFFGFSTSMGMFALFWALNGWFQGWGWPACAKLLTHWYSASERGTWWGFWNTCHNLGGALIPVLTTWLAVRMGWQSALFGPGLLCILGGFFLMNRLRDTPQSLGLPEIELYRGDAEPCALEPPPKNLASREILFDYVLRSKTLWLLGIAYFFVYLIRTAVNDWTIVFLVSERGYSLEYAGSVTMWFELGGVAGSLAAGWVSDTLFHGRRGPVNILFSVAVTGALLGMWWMPNLGWLAYSGIVALIGFLIFGPQMLIGVAAAETGHRRVSGSATGFIGCISYLGAATAGAPLGWVVETWGWESYFTVLVGCGVASVLLLLPLWSPQAGSVRRGIRAGGHDA